MIIINVNDGKKVDYSISGTILKVGDVSIDLQERQGSTQNVIDVCLDNQLQTMREGLGAWYVATIIIPPTQDEIFDTGELDENNDPVYAKRTLPLDINKVELRLWGLPAAYDPEHAENDEETIIEGVIE